MTRELVTLQEGDDLALAEQTLRLGGVRHLPVIRDGKLVGLVTERAFLDRALGAKGFGRLKVGKVMTRDPEALAARDSVAYALNKMAVGRYRHVPLVDDAGVPQGMVSARDVIDFIVELCPEEILNLPPEPQLAFHPEPEGAWGGNEPGSGAAVMPPPRWRRGTSCTSSPTRRGRGRCAPPWAGCG